jgi:sulfur-oxidizing protein SoxY
MNPAQRSVRKTGQPGETRREFLGEFLITAGLTIATIVIGPTAVWAAPEQVAAEIKKLFGDTPLTEGKIKLDLPTIAENGLVVPLNFEVESPMTDADYVKAIHFFADGNPNPQVATFRFTPMAPKASAQIRIRLAQTQNIIAVAEMSDGKLYTARREVKVTIGGCGG